MKPTESFKVETRGDREIIMTRLFEAPRELVFDALTKPELVKRWLLGPEGWSMPVCEIDLKVGGSYRYVWRNNDGREMEMGGKYTEIVKPERLVHTERFEDAWYDGESLNTWILSEKDGNTTVTVTMRYNSQKTRDGVLESGMERGVGVSYDRLDQIFAEQLAKTA